MHEELNRPLRADGTEAPCECTCKASQREGEESGVENVRMSNFLATQNDIGG